MPCPAESGTVELEGASGFQSTLVSSDTVYNQWTVFPEGYDPEAAGLRFMPSPAGDWDGNDIFDHADIDILSHTIRGGWPRFFAWWLPDAAFDLNRDGNVSHADHHVWVKEVKQTWFGDANLDGEFGTSDLLQVFAAGRYENDLPGDATWSTGDWNADGDFTSSDLAVAFQDGGYEQGRRAAAVVPEPTSIILLTVALLGIVSRTRRGTV